MSTDVRLPKNVTPVFPDACCACGAPRPGDRVSVANRRFRWYELIWPWSWFLNKRVRVEVPVCAGCRPALLAGRRWRSWILAGVIVAVVSLAYPWAKSIGAGRTVAKVVVLAVCVVCLAPLMLWWALHPPPFDTTVGADHVDYEFASAEYARQFAACNPAAPARS
ncbi:MAG: hypothetical protein WBO45_24955 [Planctomycetota bacterium]